MRRQRDRKLRLRVAIVVLAFGHAAIAMLPAQTALAQFDYAGSGELAVPTDGQVQRLPPVAEACFPSDVLGASSRCRPGLSDLFWVDCLARGYYLNDQGIQWSGLEGTFGVEAVVAPAIK